MYEYVGLCTDVYDGDTITVDIDLGFGIWMRGQKIRLKGIDTPELRGDERPEGLEVRDFVKQKILGRYVLLQTAKAKGERGKYGRWIAAIFYSPVSFIGERESVENVDPSTLTELNVELVDTGRARFVDY